MIETLMIKFGLKKTYSKEYFLGLLYHLIDRLAEQRLEIQQKENYLPESKSEIKIFFWYISSPIIQKYATKDFAHEVMNHFRHEIIFSDIDEMEYSDTFLQQLLIQRFEFYDDYLTGDLPPMKFQDIINTQKIIWFKRPFELIDPNTPGILDYNIFDSMIANKELKETTFKLVKEYRKRLKKILKSTKQNVA